ncbi:hypothetical protein GCM10023175_21340 [Pseudonocardia xishanensis]|uniref:Short subunit dehydrogenase n=1 Tax=Pseudonocardia xishanensis TaxID=630995 RepID=A0ABP8RQ77_9PSEU
MNHTTPVPFLTGGGGGIGSVTARELARAGYAVVVSDIDLDAAKATVAGVHEDGGVAEAVRLDATSRADVIAAVDGVVDRFGRLDLAVNNAGLQHFAAIDDITEDHLYSLVNLNLAGYV